MKEERSKKAHESPRVADRTLRSGGSEAPAAAAERRPDATTAPGPELSEPLPPALDSGGAKRFRDGGEIARGGMGSIRRVYDTLLRREVAMKVGDPSNPTYAQTALRFMEEAQITGQLDHPNIVPVHDLGAGADSKGVFFTMKLVEGETLSLFIERMHRGDYDHRAIERFLEVFGKICDALSFAHSRGVVHRDLKPDNVMVGSHGQVYVMDWGVALLSRVPEKHAEIARVTLSDDLSQGTREEAGAIVGTF
jgi:serine/threonine-protein kinase